MTSQCSQCITALTFATHKLVWRKRECNCCNTNSLTHVLKPTFSLSLTQELRLSLSSLADRVFQAKAVPMNPMGQVEGLRSAARTLAEGIVKVCHQFSRNQFSLLFTSKYHCTMARKRAAKLAKLHPVLVVTQRQCIRSCTNQLCFGTQCYNV